MVIWLLSSVIIKSSNWKPPWICHHEHWCFGKNHNNFQTNLTNLQRYFHRLRSLLFLWNCRQWKKRLENWVHWISKLPLLHWHIWSVNDFRPKAAFSRYAVTVIGQNIGKNAGFRKGFYQVRPICKHACTKRLKLDVSTGLSHPLGNFWKDREEIIKIIGNNQHNKNF